MDEMYLIPMQQQMCAARQELRECNAYSGRFGLALLGKNARSLHIGMRSRRSFYICCKAERGSSGGSFCAALPSAFAGSWRPATHGAGDTSPRLPKACCRGWTRRFPRGTCPIYLSRQAGEKTGSEEEQRLRTRRRRWGLSVWDMCLVYKSGGFGAELQFFIIPVPDKDSVQLTGIIWLCNLPRPH